MITEHRDPSRLDCLIALNGMEGALQALRYLDTLLDVSLNADGGVLSDHNSGLHLLMAGPLDTLQGGIDLMRPFVLAIAEIGPKEEQKTPPFGNREFITPVVVHLPTGSGQIERWFMVRFRALSRSEEQRFDVHSAAGTDDFIRRAIVEWEGLKDEQNQPVPYSDTTLEYLLEIHEFRLALVKAYVTAMSRSAEAVGQEVNAAEAEEPPPAPTATATELRDAVIAEKLREGVEPAIIAQAMNLRKSAVERVAAKLTAEAMDPQPDAKAG